jgi:fructokinase
MRIGFDLGGTKISGLVLDAEGREHLRVRRDTPRGDYQGTIRALCEMAAELEATAGRTCSIGVGMPGTVSPRSGLVKNANSTWLNGKPFGRDLAAALGRPVRLENDANCLAVSEAVDGAAGGARVAFAVILGTGVGGGIALERRPWPGHDAIAGEWGHNPLPWPEANELPGPRCYCGRRGCIETWVSGPGLAADHGGGLSGRAVAERAAAGDAAAHAALERWRRRLARGLASVVNLLDPDVVVLGGGLSRIPHLCESLPPLIQPYVFSDGFETPIRLSHHGDDSGVRGAAWLWPGPGTESNIGTWA